MNEEKSGQESYFKKWLLIALVILCVIISWIGVIDSKTEDYVDSAIIQSTVAYGGARALNAAISVAQSTQVGISFGGEASFQPLEILDPVNDMVEDYATVMKYAIGSLITQKLIVEMLATNALKWTLFGIGVLLIIGLTFFNGKYITPLFKSFIFIALIRFMFVATILLVSLVDSSLLEKKTVEQMDHVAKATKAVSVENNMNSSLSSEEKISINQQMLDIKSQQEKLVERIKEQEEIVSNAKLKLQLRQNELSEIKGKKDVIEKLNFLSDDEEIEVAKKKVGETEDIYNAALDAQEELTDLLADLQSTQSKLQTSLQRGSGFFSNIKRKINAAQTLFSTQKIRQLLENSITAMLNLIALFILQTLIMPLVFLLLILRAFKLIWGIDPRTLMKNSIRNNVRQP